MSSNQVPSLEVGGILGRFELLLPIARGGMAQVWAARPPAARGFRKLVALKTLHSGASDLRLEDMLLEEAKLASQIIHPNVVATHELGEAQGILYLVMEWVDGLPLSEILKAESKRRIPTPVAVQILAQVCRGLHAAHELRDEHEQPLGLVHRDISPQNILIERRGVAKIVDFGVAKATARDSGLTEDGELKGKIAYMAPEQISGAPLDRRTDIFALGSVAYLLTTGNHPFRGSTVAETVQNICAGKKPTHPRELCPDYPQELERILLRALHPQPEERYESAQEMLLDLEAAFPEWTRLRFEKEVAEYLEVTVGDKLLARRNRLQRAHEEVDAGAFPSGTMRALTLSSLEVSSERGSGSSRLNPDLTSVSVEEPGRFPLRAVAVGVVVLCCLIAFQVSILTEGRAGSEAPPEVASASAVRTEPSKALPEPEVEAPEHDSEDVPPPVESAREMDSPTPDRATPAPTPRATPTKRSSLRKKSAPNAGSEEVTGEKQPAPAPVDAWDLDSFGSRH